MMVNNNHDFMDRMCPNELQMKIVVNWLGLKLYDRRNDTSFPIVIIPFLCSNTCLRSLNIIMRYFSVFDVFSMFVHVDYCLSLIPVLLVLWWHACRSILIYVFFLSRLGIICLHMNCWKVLCRVTWRASYIRSRNCFPLSSTLFISGFWWSLCCSSF